MMRLTKAWMLTAVLTVAAITVIGMAPLVGQTAQTAADRKKLIEYGWDCPNTAYVRQNITKMQKRPFNGVIIQVTKTSIPRTGGTRDTLGWMVFGKYRFQPVDYEHAIEDLKATKFENFSDNFIQMISMPGLDWFDPEWSAVAHNARVLARVAKQGGCVGLMFDPEQYRHSMWTLPNVPRNGVTKEQYVAKVAERGGEFMRAINSEFPDVKILSLFGPSHSLNNPRYGLLATFTEGMCRAATPGTVIVDGYEQSYGYENKSNFEAGRHQMKVEARDLFQDKAAFDRVMRVGFGLWIDCKDCRPDRREWHVTDFSRNNFSPDQFRGAASAALDVSDEYVWIYSERPNWWTGGNLPDAYHEALARGRSQ